MRRKSPLIVVAVVALCSTMGFAVPSASGASTDSVTMGQRLPDSVSSSLSDEDTVVSPELAVTGNGEIKNVETGAVVTDSKLVGTQSTPPDPLEKTDGKTYIPVTVGEVREQSRNSDKQSGSNASAADSSAHVDSAVYAENPSRTMQVAENSQYGAYWGTYNNSQAFFQKGGAVFAQNAQWVIDVSKHNGTIDWQQAKDAGVQGAIIRIGYGDGGDDEQARRNISECKRLGIPFGVYLYSYAYDADFARGEGKWTLSQLRNFGVSPSDLTYPIYYDLEQWSWTGHHVPTDPNAYEQIARAWYEKLESAGYGGHLGIYSYTSYLNSSLNTNWIHDRVSWVAQYSGHITYTAFAADSRAWQYTSSGSVQGVAGSVDLSAFGVRPSSSSSDTSHGNTANGNASSSTFTGWKTVGGERHWFDDGVEAKSKEIYDPGSGAWYWIDADGTMAHDKDVFLSSNGGKWVRYDHDGRMVKGEDFRYGGWYLFDGVTGEMAKGVAHVDSNGGKWVYYDTVTGQMAHGERYLDYDAAHTGWYLFDGVTGAMAHGDVFVSSNGGKWVRYDRVSGQMVKGLQWQDGSWYYFDRTTGAMAHGNAWVPEWNRTAHFDEITGRYTGDAPSANEPQKPNTTYKNCKEVWQAVGHPIKKGEPGYSPDLDNDHDGTACETRPNY